MNQNPTYSLLWHCWRRTRHAIAIQLLAVLGFGILYLVYFAPEESEIIRANVVTLTAFIGAWLLSAVMSSLFAQTGPRHMGFGFPFKSEFHFPISSFRLTAVPLAYCAGVSYLCFLVPAMVLATAFDLALPPALVHFMLLEYFLIVLSLSWFSAQGPESLIATAIFLACFYFELLIPEFSIDSETSAFVAGPWSSTIMPALITIASVAVLFIGVGKQRSGENFIFRSGRSKNIPETLSAITWYRFVTSNCPTHSGRAAFIWRLRQSRGIQSSIGMGVTMGAIVLLVLYFLQLREFSESDYTLEEVSAFTIIAFCSVFTAAMATMFGLSFRNGVARLSVFDRTMPLSTAEITTIRITITMLCVLLTGITLILFVGLLGPLIIENFESVRVEFFRELQNVLDRGMVYATLRGVLLLCFVYILAVLWAVCISWFSVRTRFMSIVFSSLMIYGILSVAVMVALDIDGQTFLKLSRAVRDFHLWIMMTAMIGSLFYFFNRLLKDEVITAQQVFALCAIGFVLAAIQVVMHGVDGRPGTFPTLAVNTWDQLKGLLPLFATVLALWTQQKLRHE